MTKEDQILEILHEHTKKFDAFQGQFNSIENKVDTLQGQFNSLENKVDTLQGQFNSLESTVTNINQTVIVLENEFKDKTSALFDGHAMNQEHLEKNDKNLEDVQTILENHSIRLISLEIDSKEHTKQLENLSSK